MQRLLKAPPTHAQRTAVAPRSGGALRAAVDVCEGGTTSENQIVSQFSCLCFLFIG